ncbi:MAG: DUF2752 domain-containing protein [Planctomycetota bacterium]|nr:MAG: DUF2752 domain-containing protein [Planctomycetota bacterium]
MTAILRRFFPAILLLLWLAVAFLAEASPEGVTVAGQTLPDLCPAAARGGRCPGCGLGRATVSLMQGSVQQAWDLHLGAFPLLFLAVWPIFLSLSPTSPRRGIYTALLVAFLLLSGVQFFLRS